MANVDISSFEMIKTGVNPSLTKANDADDIKNLINYKPSKALTNDELGFERQDTSGFYEPLINIKQIGASTTLARAFKLFDSPYGICISGTQVFLDDTNNHRIVEVDTFLNLKSNWGTYGTGNDNFDDPNNIHIFSSSLILVSDANNDRVIVRGGDGVYVNSFGSTGATDGKFDTPDGIGSVNSEIYVADSVNGRMQVFNSSYAYQRKWDVAGENPTGVFCYTSTEHSQNVCVVSDASSDTIYIYSSTGTTLDSWGSATLSGPNGVWINSTGEAVYVCDTNNHCIRKFDIDGTLSATYGTAGTASSDDGEFYYPYGITSDGTHLYVTDTLNHRIQKLLLSDGSFVKKL